MRPVFRALQRTPTPAGMGLASARAPEDKLRLLRAADLFRDLTDEDVEQVGHMTVMSHCERGQTIYAPDETGEALFLLKRGRVHIYRLGVDGKKLTLSTVEAGTVFGDMSLTGQRMFDGYAEAAEDSMLCVMSRHDVELLINQYPSIGVQLVRMLADQVRELEDRLEESSLRDVPSRVAAALARAAEQQGRDVATTHQELADLVGTHRETVTRTLGELRDRRLIALRRHHIEILDLEGLREVAGRGDTR